jgi:predicted RNA binding protein YcfA (HicA-like mRNA interferase family)
VKRRNLLRLIADAAHVRRLAWTLVRQGGDHEVWALDGKRITIPRHREINDQTARAILTAFEEVLGRRWWER